MALANIISKIFGSKADKDMKAVKPILDKILAQYDITDKLSNDELRARSAALREQLRQCEAPFEARIQEIKQALEGDLPISEKESLLLWSTMKTAKTKAILLSPPKK